MFVWKIVSKSSTIDADSKLEFLSTCGTISFSFEGIPSCTDLLVEFEFSSAKKTQI